MQKHRPVRMCVACRKRQSQSALLRLQLENGKIVPYAGAGRSFYLCSKCRQDTRQMRSVAKRLRLDPEQIERLKEFTTDGES